MSFSWITHNFTRVEKKKQHLKREKEKEDRRDVLEEKYDALKETCDKMELLLKQLAEAQLKRGEKEELADITGAAGRNQHLNCVYCPNKRVSE